MSGVLSEIGALRQSAAFQALISVNEKMGIPLFIDGKVLFIPFFSEKNGKYAVTSELHFDCLSKKIIRYEKTYREVDLNINDEILLRFKQVAIESDFRYPCSFIPEKIKSIYPYLQEEKENDKNQNCI